MNIKSIAKGTVGKLLTDYQINRVYHIDLHEESKQTSTPATLNFALIGDQAELDMALDARVRDHAWYGDEKDNSLGFRLSDGEHIVCTAWYWRKQHSRLPRRFASIDDNELVLADLITADGMRGRGYAGLLMNYADGQLYRKGHTRLWTWIWHSNKPSIIAFEKAGWSYDYFLVEFRLPFLKRFFSIRLPRL